MAVVNMDSVGPNSYSIDHSEHSYGFDLAGMSARWQITREGSRLKTL